VGHYAAHPEKRARCLLHRHVVHHPQTKVHFLRGNLTPLPQVPWSDSKEPVELIQYLTKYLSRPCARVNARLKVEHLHQNIDGQRYRAPSSSMQPGRFSVLCRAESIVVSPSPLFLNDFARPRPVWPSCRFSREGGSFVSARKKNWRNCGKLRQTEPGTTSSDGAKTTQRPGTRLHSSSPRIPRSAKEVVRRGRGQRPGCWADLNQGRNTVECMV